MTYLFTDASYDARLKFGVGASLLLPAEETKVDPARIQTKLMSAEGIARLEIMTVLWALAESRNELNSTALHLFTDCRAIELLFTRRAKLEERNYQTRGEPKELANADLYRRFFKAYDDSPFELTWIKGHSPRRDRSEIQHCFSYVDKAAREALRLFRKSR
jgi:ribonuclease HI